MMQFWNLLRCCGEVGGNANLSGLEKRNIFLVNGIYLVEKALRGNKHVAENCCLGKWSLR